MENQHRKISGYLSDSDPHNFSDGVLATFRTYSVRWRFGEPGPEMLMCGNYEFRSNAGKQEWVRVQIDPADAIHR